MKLTVLLLLSTFLSRAMADGFVCDTADRALSVSVYDHLVGGKDTGRAAILVIADTKQPVGVQTIATFRASEGQLTNDGGVYTALTAEAFNGSPARDVTAMDSTKWGDLSKIVLTVAFSDVEPLDDGVVVPGILSLVDQAGHPHQLSLDCARVVTTRK